MGEEREINRARRVKVGEVRPRELPMGAEVERDQRRRETE
jgi:hypothetical protein